jgi:hypothetical protein
LNKLVTGCLIALFHTLGASAEEINFNTTPICSGCTDTEKFIEIIKDSKFGDVDIYFPNGNYNIDYGTTNRNDNMEYIEKLTLHGQSRDGSIIQTKGLNFKGINHLKLENITINGEEGILTTTDPYEALVNTGSLGYGLNTESVYIHRTIIKNSGSDLLKVWGVNSFRILTSDITRAGLKNLRHHWNDKTKRYDHWAGNGITLTEVKSSVVKNVWFKAIRRAGIMALTNSHNIDISGNTFQLKNDYATEGHPNYGYLGGTCFYQTGHDNSNVTFINNECNDYLTNGVRMDGPNMVVKDNHFNHKKFTACDNDTFRPIGVAANGVKIHYGSNLIIENNCIRHSTNGIAILPVDKVSATIKNNTIKDARYGILACTNGVFQGEHDVDYQNNNNISGIVRIQNSSCW